MRMRMYLLLATLVAATATALAIPTSAQAACTFDGFEWKCDGYGEQPATWLAPVSPTFKGWGVVNTRSCGVDGGCLAIYPTAPAWRWSGSRWVATTRTNHVDVYIWPFGGDYMWTWTAQTGWLAMRMGDLSAEKELSLWGTWR